MHERIHMNSAEITAKLVEARRSGDGDAFLAVRGLGALADRMEIVMTEFTAERAIATMPVEGNTQPLGLLHGGAYVVLGESLGSMHANFLAPEGHVAVGVDINATHTSSAVDGTVTGVCHPIRIGSTIAVHEIIISDTRGRRLSTVRITNYFKRYGREEASPSSDPTGR